MYWALRNWLTTFAQRWGLEVSLVDTTNLDELREHAESQRALEVETTEVAGRRRKFFESSIGRLRKE